MDEEDLEKKTEEHQSVFKCRYSTMAVVLQWLEFSHRNVCRQAQPDAGLIFKGWEFFPIAVLLCLSVKVFPCCEGIFLVIRPVLL